MAYSATLDVAIETHETRTAARWAGLRFSLLVWLIVRIVLSGWGAYRLATAPPELYQAVHARLPQWDLPGHDLAGYTIGVWNLYDTPSYTGIAQHGYVG